MILSFFWLGPRPIGEPGKHLQHSQYWLARIYMIKSIFWFSCISRLSGAVPAMQFLYFDLLLLSRAGPFGRLCDASWQKASAATGGTSCAPGEGEERNILIWTIYFPKHIYIYTYILGGRAVHLVRGRSETSGSQKYTVIFSMVRGGATHLDFPKRMQIFCTQITNSRHRKSGSFLEHLMIHGNIGFTNHNTFISWSDSDMDNSEWNWTRQLDFGSLQASSTLVT